MTLTPVPVLRPQNLPVLRRSSLGGEQRLVHCHTQSIRTLPFTIHKRIKVLRCTIHVYRTRNLSKPFQSVIGIPDLNLLSHFPIHFPPCTTPVALLPPRLRSSCSTLTPKDSQEYPHPQNPHLRQTSEPVVDSRLPVAPALRYSNHRNPHRARFLVDSVVH